MSSSLEIRSEDTPSRQSCLIAISLFLFLLLFPLAGWAAVQEKTIPEILTEAKVSFEKGEWDEAEIKYLKAARSPEVEERIQAYEGLMSLYKKLKHFKKAQAIQKKLAAEKSLQTKLVPQGDSYYKIYKIQKGDTYGKIAAREFISLEWLQRANWNKLLVAGKTIRLPKFSDFLEVDKVKKTLTWKRGSGVLKIYPIAIGQEGMETPNGEFTIISKVKNPVWYHMKQEFPPDSPKNLLGTRWLGLNKKGYGIHGTRHPWSIGSAASHGCVRMHNYDVEELFEWIPLNTKVRIRSSS